MEPLIQQIIDNITNLADNLVWQEETGQELLIHKGTGRVIAMVKRDTIGFLTYAAGYRGNLEQDGRFMFQEKAMQFAKLKALEEIVKSQFGVRFTIYGSAVYASFAEYDRKMAEAKNSTSGSEK
jgi:hypothetical protein